MSKQPRYPVPPIQTLVLFDIDGTLIDTGSAGSAAMSEAREATLSIKNAFERIRMDGKTDIQITKEALNGISTAPNLSVL